MDKSNFYVGLKNDTDIRRNILESSKGIVNCLQNFHKFENIRQKKLAEILKLRSLIREIQSLSLQFKKGMPSLTEEPVPRPKVAKVRQTRVVEQQQASDDMEKLESDLSKIEAKLRSLMQ